MATAALRRTAWIAAAGASVLAIAVIALHGERRGAGFVRYEPRGAMVHLPAELATSVEVGRGGRRFRFVRAAAGTWRAEPDSPRATPGLAEALESGLRLLHGSPPQRVIEREELAGTRLDELGLAPPRFIVSVFAADRPPFVIEFGASNPQGLARYARIAGHEEILLLNRYVADPWEKVTSP